MKTISLYSIPLALLLACAPGAETEKHQGARNHIINVHDKVKEIPTDSILLSNAIVPYIINEYLIIEDYKSPDETIHLFDKNTFEYRASTAYKGMGPGEIARIGHIAIDEARRTFYVTDLAKMKVFGYQLDSVLRNPRGYLPQEKANLAEGRFPSYYHFISDTLSIGSIIEPVGVSDFRQAMGKWNILTGEIKLMPYAHPEVKKVRTTFAASPEHGIYVTCYLYQDLMTICTLDGELKYNIYGPKWEANTPNRYGFYDNVHICGNRIIAHYSDGADASKAIYPTQFLVFDIDGNYLQTLETDYQIVSFCHDRENNRLILTLNDEPQVAYLNLDEAGL